MSFTLENPLSPYFIGITLAVYLVTASTLPQLLKGSRNNRRFLLFYILTGAASLVLLPTEPSHQPCFVFLRS